jgi:hypothetical protein
MSIVPTDHDFSGCPRSGGILALVDAWLADLTLHPTTQAHRAAALRREIDAFAWQLVGRMDGIDAGDAGPGPEIPLDSDQPNR